MNDGQFKEPTADSTSAETRRPWLADPEIRESLLASSLLCLLLLGLPYIVALLWVTFTGLAARGRLAAGPILVCGHRLEGGEISPRYRARLDEAARLARRSPEQFVVLLGGGRPSEAAAGRDYLVATHGIDPRRLLLEQASADSLENLRNARDLLRARGLKSDAVLISSRYHLARLATLSRQLGLRCRRHPAERRRQLGPGDVKAGLVEAAFLCWFVLGRFYARVAGREKLLARIR